VIPGTDTTFPLAGLLRVAEVCRALKVSDQTVYNWIEEGLPVAHVEPGAGPNGGDAKWFDLDAVKAWRKKHKPDGGVIHGGKRKGAGRKAEGTRQATKRRSDEGAEGTEEAKATRLDPLAPTHPHTLSPSHVSPSHVSPHDPTHALTLPGAAAHAAPGRSASVNEADDLFTAAEKDEADALTRALGGMSGLLAAVKNGKVLPVEAHAARLAAETQIKMVELGKATGELVEVAGVRDQMMRAFGTVRSVLENLPDKMASQAISQIGMSQAQQNKLREMVDAEVKRAMDGLVRAFG
jgi:hypothetical protein